MRNRKSRNVFILSPHLDDAAIGLGGIIKLHSENRDNVFVIFMTNWSDDILESKKAAEHSNRVLGVKKEFFLNFQNSYLSHRISDAVEEVQKIFLNDNMDIVYTPHRKDGHPDHIATNRIAFESSWKLHIKDKVIFDSIREYEIWTPMETYTALYDITKYIKEKKEAISVFSKFANTNLLIDGIIGLNRYRAMHHETLQNEGDFFEAIREINQTQIIHDPTVLG